MNKTRVGRIVLAYYLLQKNFLSKYGWTKTVLLKQPVNREKEPIPWFTYSFIAFIRPRIRADFKVFEFGSGNSTLWLSSLGCEVFSVEHDEKWYRMLEPKFSKIPNVHSSLESLEANAYSRSILKYEQQFDVIIIDGRDRIQCCKNSLNALKPEGVIIWDNADRMEYAEGYEILQNNGFKRIDFQGMGPINSKPWCTALFYRQDNCLKV
ncbi:class I SAM-dependent methyltransferase [Poritiphilus flavus]|uniref:FkbM family methyltransferase n=1 Tax=Poritiphilus flavus TaxID=2697053 RepID=A0A6L9EE88_9FLAO|nr:class I SAM-dependent methyltransferase [Poritiphilus flavus]NAS13035.1 FkbM family methyltransferase [Poritiphilus flavus]